MQHQAFAQKSLHSAQYTLCKVQLTSSQFFMGWFANEGGEGIPRRYLTHICVLEQVVFLPAIQPHLQKGEWTRLGMPTPLSTGLCNNKIKDKYKK